MSPSRLRLAILALSLTGSFPALASTAYGDLNNFDVVNDTGQDTHGFEIEIEDVQSSSITYTYDWNHYGTPVISQDNSDPAHTKVRIRYAARFDTATGQFSAYTAVPVVPIPPTQGHQCTDPSVNLGCEHFGVGYYGATGVVRYFWLVADPASTGSLTRGAMVNVATPSFTYYPPVVNVQPVAQVAARIQMPEPPEAPVKEFGEATWVKEIITTTHNNAPVELRDLVSDDPNDPNDRNWANGEPAEVEVEWSLLQTEFANPAAPNNELAGQPQELPGGDEVITRRYEFYKYTGPYDAETNEALCSNYPAVADPANAQYDAACDPAVVTILGDYIGAQMAGFDVAAPLGTIDHLQDGERLVPYPDRTVVVGGNTPYTVSILAGALPAGLVLNPQTGVMSGTPTVTGAFPFSIHARDADGVEVDRAYTLTVVDPDGAVTVQHRLAVAKTGGGSGTVTGSGIDCGPTCSALLDEGSVATLAAAPSIGSAFYGWQGACVGTGACNVTMNADASVTAIFRKQKYRLQVGKLGTGTGTVTGGGIDCGALCIVSLDAGLTVTLHAEPSPGSRFEGWRGACTGTGDCTVTMSSAKRVVATFSPMAYKLNTQVSGPAGSGRINSTPAGIRCGTLGADCYEPYAPGTVVTLVPVAASGRHFVGWSGACVGMGPCVVTMDRDQQVTGTFE